MKSHYSRAKQNKRHKYLSPLLNVAEMHNLYLEKYEPDAAKPIVSYRYYLKYFNENFNMSFGYPRADTCGTCDALNIQIEGAGGAQKVSLQSQKEDHLRRAENFYASLRTNTCLAKLNVHIATVTLGRICRCPISWLEKFSTCTNSGCMFLVYMNAALIML